MKNRTGQQRRNRIGIPQGNCIFVIGLFQVIGAGSVEFDGQPRRPGM